MQKVKANNKKEVMNTKCPCKVEGDTTKYVLQCQAGSKSIKFHLKDQRYENWDEIVEIFKRNKET